MKKCFGFLLLLISLSHCLATPLEDQLKKFGEKTLLVINFNHAYYGNIPFFKEVYGKYFPHMVFYGEVAAPGVEVCRTRAGGYAYITLAEAMKKFPNYAGYLWLNDDCGITLGRLGEFDPSKIWASCLGFGSYSPGDIHGGIELTKGKSATSWMWWALPMGHDAVMKVLKELKTPEKELLQGNNNPNQFPYGMAEAYYIPRKYAKKAEELCRLCYKHELWIELAFPFIIDCLEVRSNREELKILWGVPFKEVYQEYDFFHPIKLSQQDNRQFMANIFNDL